MDWCLWGIPTNIALWKSYHRFFPPWASRIHRHKKGMIFNIRGLYYQRLRDISSREAHNERKYVFPHRPQSLSWHTSLPNIHIGTLLHQPPSHWNNLYNFQGGQNTIYTAGSISDKCPLCLQSFIDQHSTRAHSHFQRCMSRCSLKSCSQIRKYLGHTLCIILYSDTLSTGKGRPCIIMLLGQGNIHHNILSGIHGCFGSNRTLPHRMCRSMLYSRRTYKAPDMARNSGPIHWKNNPPRRMLRIIEDSLSLRLRLLQERTIL